MKLSPYQIELRNRWLALISDQATCEHHYHGPNFIRIGVGDCQCDVNATKHIDKETIQSHRHGFDCCRCRKTVECNLPFNEAKEMTDECRAIYDAYLTFVNTLPPLGG